MPEIMVPRFQMAADCGVRRRLGGMASASVAFLVWIWVLWDDRNACSGPQSRTPIVRVGTGTTRLAGSKGFPIPADNFPNELACMCDSVGKSPAWCGLDAAFFFSLRYELALPARRRRLCQRRHSDPCSAGPARLPFRFSVCFVGRSPSLTGDDTVTDSEFERHGQRRAAGRVAWWTSEMILFRSYE